MKVMSDKDALFKRESEALSSLSAGREVMDRVIFD